MPVLTRLNTKIGVDLIGMECVQCGCVFSMSEGKYDRCRKLGEHWWCPNGHSNYFGDTEVQKLENQLALQRRDNDWLKMDLKESKNKTKTAKAAKTKLKNRIANGVCPCCNRSFTNLHRHINTKHPNYKK